MARIKFREWNPDLKSQERILKINAILAEYSGRVTIRQVYYRLVGAGVIANKQEEYRAIQGLITKARYAGLIDWDDIEDRNRGAVRPQEFESGRDLLDRAVGAFRLDRWRGQPFYIELWVEKAALAGVLSPISNDYHITLMVNRGYSSASAMKESADRIRARIRPSPEQPHGHRPVVLYLGDHDPSGEDMVRDIGERLREFGCPGYLDVRKVALTMEQIQKYNPPPNPAKLADVRAAAYIEKHGEYSWEVDALPPNVLDLIVRTTINAYVDKKAMEEAITRENLIKAKIKQFAAGFKD
jgi:hypothetical protein